MTFQLWKLIFHWHPQDARARLEGSVGIGWKDKWSVGFDYSWKVWAARQ